jgi:2-keto-3-deoxy-L-rhamnonate aldolase RhmA
MIETRGGLEHVNEIAAVDGVDVLFMAPHDLALALGRAPQALYDTDSGILDYASALVEAAEEHGKVAGAIAFDAEQGEALLERGIRWLNVQLSNPRDEIADLKQRFSRH